MSVNKAILVGNVGKDPEVRYLDSGVAVATITLATTERGYTLANGTTVPDRTEWHNIVAWRLLAEFSEKYIHKGSQIYVEGKIQTRTYEKDGIKRYVTEIYADTIQLLGKKPEIKEAEAPGVASVAEPVLNNAEVTLNAEDDLPF